MKVWWVVASLISVAGLACSDVEPYGPYRAAVVEAGCGEAGGPAISVVIEPEVASCSSDRDSDRLELNLSGWAFEQDGEVDRQMQSDEHVSLCSPECEDAPLRHVDLYRIDDETYGVVYELERDDGTRVEGRATATACNRLEHACF